MLLLYSGRATFTHINNATLHHSTKLVQNLYLISNFAVCSAANHTVYTMAKFYCNDHLLSVAVGGEGAVRQKSWPFVCQTNKFGVNIGPFMEENAKLTNKSLQTVYL